MYSYYLHMYDPDDACFIKLINEQKFTQEEFIDIVNTAIANYCYEEEYAYVSSHSVNKNIVEDLINNYGFSRPKQEDYQAFWEIPTTGFFIEDDENIEHSIIKDIQNKVNERIRT